MLERPVCARPQVRREDSVQWVTSSWYKGIMRLAKTLLLSVIVAFGVSKSASALVTIDLSSPFVGYAYAGAIINVDVTVTWDGAGSLTGVFTSHTWDSTQFALIGADSTLGAPGMFETRPNILPGTSFAPTMGRFGTIAAGVAGDDLTSSARTVQYGTVTPLASSRAGSNLVTRLTFQFIGLGDVLPIITGVNLLGDTGANGDSFQLDSIAFTPEPGTAVLMGLGLLGLGARRIRRRQA